MRRKIISAASAAALALGMGIGVASSATADEVPLCQFADAQDARQGDCVVGDVAADGVTVIYPTGPAYGDASTATAESSATTP
jgi:hypothetical protein